MYRKVTEAHILWQAYPCSCLDRKKVCVWSSPWA